MTTEEGSTKQNNNSNQSVASNDSAKTIETLNSRISELTDEKESLSKANKSLTQDVQNLSKKNKEIIDQLASLKALNTKVSDLVAKEAKNTATMTALKVRVEELSLENKLLHEQLGTDHSMGMTPPPKTREESPFIFGKRKAAKSPTRNLNLSGIMNTSYSSPNRFSLLQSMDEDEEPNQQQSAAANLSSASGAMDGVQE
jgi:cell division protein FtsB